MSEIQNELNALKCKAGIIRKVFCSKEEQIEFARMRREGIAASSISVGDIYMDAAGSFFRYESEGLSKEEIVDLYAFRQLRYLRTIKNSMVFFVVLVVFFLVAVFGVFVLRGI